MAQISFPSIIGPSSITFGIRGHSQTFTSEFTGSSQYVRLPGSRWYGTATWDNLDGADFDELKAFLTELEGPHNSFLFGDVSRDTPRSGLAANYVIETASSFSNHLTQIEVRKESGSPTISGTQSLFKKGDYFQISTTKGLELKISTTDSTIQNSGNHQVNFAPALRGGTATGANLTRHSPRGLMRLSDTDQVNWDIRAPVVGNTTISFLEAF